MSHAAERMSQERRSLAPAPARPFARVELEPASTAWDDLAGAGSAYQRPDFVAAWAQAFGARLQIVVARDGAGRTVALLPLHVRRYGPLAVAGFAGGGWANYHMGLFRPGLVWRGEDVAALLRGAARAAGIDVFAFSHQPARWAGVDNPMRLLPSFPSPSSAFATKLGATHAEWLDAHFSHATQKKQRKKARKLDALGPVSYVRARDDAERRRFLDALLAHKAAQARARGEADPFARAEVRDLLDRLCQGEAPVLEMHALLAGERVAATLAAMRDGARLSGLAISYDAAPEVAAASPGEWLLMEVVREARARGVETFDLGVGESRYKREICEIEEALFDTAFAANLLGRAGAAGFLFARRVLGWVKRRPPLFRLAKRLALR